MGMSTSTDKRPTQPSKLYTVGEVEEMAKQRAGWSGIFTVAKIEQKLFFYLCGSFLLISFVYSLSREFKDALVLANQEMTSINFLKTFGVPPLSIIFSLLCLYLLKTKTSINVLSILLNGFGVYFAFFGLIVLNFKSLVEPSEFFKADFKNDNILMKGLLSGMVGPLLVCLNYLESLHFIATEIYGAMVLSNIFMMFLNESVSFNQLMRFFPLLYVGSNVALIMSGLSVKLFNYVTADVLLKTKEMVVTGVFVLCGVFCFLSAYLAKKAYEESKVPIYLPTEVTRKKKKSKNLTSEESNALLSSKMMLAICFTVIGYGSLTNMTESSYKSSMRAYALHSNIPSDRVVLQYNSNTQIITGLAVALILITPFNRSVKSFGLKSVGLLTPITCFLGSTIVFLFAAYNIFHSGKNVPKLTSLLLGMFATADPAKAKIKAELFTGMVAASAIKIFKYAAFDICKELVSIKIDPDYRPHVKAFSDGMCGKFGKASGSLFALFATAIMGVKDVRATSIVGMLISAVISLVWIFCIFIIAGKYNTAVSENKYISFGTKKEGQEGF